MRHACQMGCSCGSQSVPCRSSNDSRQACGIPAAALSLNETIAESYMKTWLCRYAKSYEAVHLEDVPHRVLTRPKKVFEYVFEGQRPARGRENMVKLDVSAIATVAVHTATFLKGRRYRAMYVMISLDTQCCSKCTSVFVGFVSSENRPQQWRCMCVHR